MIMMNLFSLFVFFLKFRELSAVGDIINYTKKQTSLYLVAVDFSQKVQNLYR